MANATDKLIELTIGGDRVAADKLASDCLPHVWRTVYLCCGNRTEVEDLVQTAIVRMLEKLPTYRAEGKFTAWMDRLTINVVRGHFRRTRFFDALLASRKLELPSPDGESPDRRAEGRRLLARLARHVSAVREKNRTVLVLSIVRDYSVAEIADAVGCTEEAAKKRLQRGRLELIEKLERDPYCERMIEEFLS